MSKFLDVEHTPVPPRLRCARVGDTVDSLYTLSDFGIRRTKSCPVVSRLDPKPFLLIEVIIASSLEGSPRFLASSRLAFWHQVHGDRVANSSHRALLLSIDRPSLVAPVGLSWARPPVERVTLDRDQA